MVQKFGCTGPCGNIVEFGCGYGHFTIAAARAVTGTVYALDIDPAMIDGGLQLARLWGIRMFGESTLPTAIGSYTGYRSFPENESVVCRIRSERRGRYKTVSQLAWLTEQGDVIAELRNVEMHIVAGQ